MHPLRVWQYLYFNPRSREGSDVDYPTGSRRSLISIHAPAKGATLRGCMAEKKDADFNPRSREGSDDNKNYLREGTEYFNPRSREGSDTIPRPRRRIQKIFQSTLPRRERLMVHEALLTLVGFQSTLPRRERLIVS